jgi:hypothetical protein
MRGIRSGALSASQRSMAMGSAPGKLPGGAALTYDVIIDFAEVGQPGNPSIGVKGFEPPSEKTVPARNSNGNGSTTYKPLTAGNYQQLGAVPYVYEIGQYEITAKQYVSFLNAVDPDGSNDKMPWTGITLYSNRFSPIENPYQGQIIQLKHAKTGEHYALANESWANKPMMWANMFQYLYYVNSLENGTIVGESRNKVKNPNGAAVNLSKKYIRYSDNILSGTYNLNDYNYPLARRQNISGFVLPSENEWTKAAYYSGNKDTGNGTPYYYYPTSSNKAPQPLISAAWAAKNKKNPAEVNVDGNGNVIADKLNNDTLKTIGYANYNSQVFWKPNYAPLDQSKANVTDVGGAATPSPWLTYDQGGNVVEYTDTATAAIKEPDTQNKENVPVYFKIHGGIANAVEYQLWLTATGTSNPYGQNLGSVYQYGGARVGYVPGNSNNKTTPISTLKPSAIADPLTGAGVVTRIDSGKTFDTFYTTSNKAAIDILKSNNGYLFIAAPFREPSTTNKQAVDIYRLLHTATKTHFYTFNKAERDQLLKDGTYSGGDVGFRAFKPKVGSVEFVKFFNKQTGAYGFTSSPEDFKFFENQNYVFAGPAWSV